MSITSAIDNADLNNTADDDRLVKEAAASITEKYIESFERDKQMSADDFRKFMYDYVSRQKHESV
jgi:hypothetical protein